MKQIEMKKDYATLVRGKDNFNNFELVDPPIHDLSSESIKLHQNILNEQNKVFYK
jgi:non-heme Fe2+,alpha-ketoglutarate-dependent halogenase